MPSWASWGYRFSFGGICAVLYPQHPRRSTEIPGCHWMPDKEKALISQSFCTSPVPTGPLHGGGGGSRKVAPRGKYPYFSYSYCYLFLSCAYQLCTTCVPCIFGSQFDSRFRNITPILRQCHSPFLHAYCSGQISDLIAIYWTKADFRGRQRSFSQDSAIGRQAWRAGYTIPSLR